LISYTAIQSPLPKREEYLLLLILSNYWID